MTLIPPLPPTAILREVGLADMRLGVECLLTEDASRALQIAQQLSEVHLLRIDRSHKALALVAEDLALEPLDLAFELLDLRGLALQQLRYLPRPERGHRGGIWNSGLQCQGHGPHVTEDACGTAEDCPQWRGQR